MTASRRSPRAIHQARSVLSDWVREAAARQALRCGFRWVGVAQAPSTYQQLRGAYQHSLESGEPLPVSYLYSERTVYLSEDDNIRFRYIHDCAHVERGLSFNLEDELELALWHLSQLTEAGHGPRTLPYELLTADLIGQVVLMSLIGRFPLDQQRFVLTCQEAGLFTGLLDEIRRVG